MVSRVPAPAPAAGRATGGNAPAMPYSDGREPSQSPAPDGRPAAPPARRPAAGAAQRRDGRGRGAAARPEADRVRARRRLGGPGHAGRGHREDLPVPGLRPGNQAGNGAPGRVARVHAGAGGAAALAQPVLGPVAAPRGTRPARQVRSSVTEIRAATVLPARREDITLRTADGLALVGEIAR